MGSRDGLRLPPYDRGSAGLRTATRRPGGWGERAFVHFVRRGLGEAVDDGSQGVALADLQSLVTYWRDAYDRRSTEKRSMSWSRR